MDPQLAELLQRLADRRSYRRELRGDVLLGVMLAAIAASTAWGMWRLDDRSERLFAVVAAERASQARCP